MSQWSNELATEFGLQPSIAFDLSPQAISQLAHESIVAVQINDLAVMLNNWQTFSTDRALTSDEILRIIIDFQTIDIPISRGKGTTYLHEVMGGNVEGLLPNLVEALAQVFAHQLQSVPEIRDENLRNLEQVIRRLPMDYTPQAQARLRSLITKSPTLREALLGSPDASLANRVKIWLADLIEAARSEPAFAAAMTQEINPDFYAAIASLLPANTQVYNLGSEIPSDLTTNEVAIAAQTAYSNSVVMLAIGMLPDTLNNYLTEIDEQSQGKEF